MYRAANRVMKVVDEKLEEVFTTEEVATCVVISMCGHLIV